MESQNSHQAECACVWPFPPANLTLPLGEVHVWYADLDQAACQIESLAQRLSPDETQRADRFRFERDRKHFTVARGILRTLLGHYLNRDPSQLQFQYSDRGKPLLTEACGGQELQFNLSHSHGLALYAVARSVGVGTVPPLIGVDIERVRPFPNAEQLAERFFAEAEYAVVRSCEPEQQVKSFFRLWTCKEAYLKATGDGLAKSLNQVEIALASEASVKLTAVAGDAQEAARWCLLQLRPTREAIAAIAIQSHGWMLRHWQYPTSGMDS